MEWNLSKFVVAARKQVGNQQSPSEIAQILQHMEQEDPHFHRYGLVQKIQLMLGKATDSFLADHFEQGQDSNDSTSEWKTADELAAEFEKLCGGEALSEIKTAVKRELEASLTKLVSQPDSESPPTVRSQNSGGGGGGANTTGRASGSHMHSANTNLSTSQSHPGHHHHPHGHSIATSSSANPLNHQHHQPQPLHNAIQQHPLRRHTRSKGTASATTPSYARHHNIHHFAPAGILGAPPPWVIPGVGGIGGGAGPYHRLHPSAAIALHSGVSMPESMNSETSWADSLSWGVFGGTGPSHDELRRITANLAIINNVDTRLAAMTALTSMSAGDFATAEVWSPMKLALEKALDDPDTRVSDLCLRFHAQLFRLAPPELGGEVYLNVVSHLCHVFADHPTASTSTSSKLPTKCAADDELFMLTLRKFRLVRSMLEYLPLFWFQFPDVLFHQVVTATATLMSKVSALLPSTLTVSPMNLFACPLLYMAIVDPNATWLGKILLDIRVRVPFFTSMRRSAQAFGVVFGGDVFKESGVGGELGQLMRLHLVAMFAQCVPFADFWVTQTYYLPKNHAAEKKAHTPKAGGAQTAGGDVFDSVLVLTWLVNCITGCGRQMPAGRREIEHAAKGLANLCASESRHLFVASLISQLLSPLAQGSLSSGSTQMLNSVLTVCQAIVDSTKCHQTMLLSPFTTNNGQHQESADPSPPPTHLDVLCDHLVQVLNSTGPHPSPPQLFETVCVLVCALCVHATFATAVLHHGLVDALWSCADRYLQESGVLSSSLCDGLLLSLTHQCMPSVASGRVLAACAWHLWSLFEERPTDSNVVHMYSCFMSAHPQATGVVLCTPVGESGAVVGTLLSMIVNVYSHVSELWSPTDEVATFCSEQGHSKDLSLSLFDQAHAAEGLLATVLTCAFQQCDASSESGVWADPLVSALQEHVLAPHHHEELHIALLRVLVAVCGQSVNACVWLEQHTSLFTHFQAVFQQSTPSPSVHQGSLLCQSLLGSLIIGGPTERAPLLNLSDPEQWSIVCQCAASGTLPSKEHEPEETISSAESFVSELASLLHHDVTSLSNPQDWLSQIKECVSKILHTDYFNLSLFAETLSSAAFVASPCLTQKQQTQQPDNIMLAACAKYAQWVSGTGQPLDSVKEKLSALFGAGHTGWLPAVCFLIFEDVDTASTFLASFEATPCGRLFSRGPSEELRTFCQEVEISLCEVDPALPSVLSRCGMSVTQVLHTFFSQAFLNILDFPNIVRLLLASVLCGPPALKGFVTAFLRQHKDRLLEVGVLCSPFDGSGAPSQGIWQSGAARKALCCV